MIQELIKNDIPLTFCRTMWSFFIAIPVKYRKKSKKIIDKHCIEMDISPKYFVDYKNDCLELEISENIRQDEYKENNQFKEYARNEVRQLVKSRLLIVDEVNEFETIFRPKNSLF